MTQLRIHRRTPRHWTATFDHPPLNLMDPETIYELDALLTLAETDPELRVLVFDSAHPEFFIAHWDVTIPSDVIAAMQTRSGTRRKMHPYLDVQSRLGQLPVVTVASVRGRARGAGSELALACDVRFASRERGIFGQFEVGVGAVPGGGSTSYLPRLMGRGRALEALLGGDDFPAELAAEYGWINRALPDSELDAFVDRFAQRVAGYEKEVITSIKELVNRASLPTDDELSAALQGFLRAKALPNPGHLHLATLLGLGLQELGDVERNMGRYVARPEEAFGAAE